MRLRVAARCCSTFTRRYRFEIRDLGGFAGYVVGQRAGCNSRRQGIGIVPSLNAGPGENFPIRIDLRLLRPLQSNGPLVEIGLDGILFDDLSFYGPNRLNSRRSMTVWEMEARRDRQFFKQVSNLVVEKA